MRRRARGSLAAFVGICLASGPQVACSQTLRDTLSAAYRNNATLLAERAQLRAVDEHVAQAVSGWRPTVNIAADARTEQTSVSQAPGGRPNPYSIGNHSYFANDYGVTVTQPIYRGGRTVAATAKATAEVEAERAHLDSVEQAVMLGAATDYFDVVLGQGLVAVATEYEDAITAESKRTERLFKAGAITATDLAEANTAAIRAKAISRQGRLALDVARANFRRDTGLSAEQLKTTPFPLALPASRDQALDMGAAANPDLLAAKHLVTAGGDAIDVARGGLLPSVSLVGSIGHKDNYPFERRREDGASIGIEISIPLYDGGTSHSLVREATQTRGALERKSDAEQEAVAAAAGSAWDRLQAATDDAELASKTSEGSAAIVDGMEKEFAIGKRSVREVVDAMDALVKARITFLQAQRDEAVARFALGFTGGQLTARKLQLPVEFYDPGVHFEAVKGRWYGTGEDQP